MTILANYWVSNGWAVTLIVLVNSAESTFHQLDPWVHKIWRVLNLWSEAIYRVIDRRQKLQH
jgi:hypothetical protein